MYFYVIFSPLLNRLKHVLWNHISFCNAISVRDKTLKIACQEKSEWAWLVAASAHLSAASIGWLRLWMAITPPQATFVRRASGGALPIYGGAPRSSLAHCHRSGRCGQRHDLPPIAAGINPSQPTIFLG